MYDRTSELRPLVDLADGVERRFEDSFHSCLAWAVEAIVRKTVKSRNATPDGSLIEALLSRWLIVNRVGWMRHVDATEERSKLLFLVTRC